MSSGGASGGVVEPRGVTPDGLRRDDPARPGPVGPPSWPQLNGWLARPRVTVARARVRWGDGESSGEGRLSWTAPSAWEQAGMPSRFGLLVLAEPFERGDDYWRAAGPAEPVGVAGRPCWQVHLLPPLRKRGRLELCLDDATGLVLRTGNDETGFEAEVVQLVVRSGLTARVVGGLPARVSGGPAVQVVGGPTARDGGGDTAEVLGDLSLPATGVLAAPDLAAAGAPGAPSGLEQLTRTRPSMLPRWWPARLLTGQGQGLVEVVDGDGWVARAPLGTVPDERPAEHVVRLDHGGWSWAVGSAAPMPTEDALRVIQQIRL